MKTHGHAPPSVLREFVRVGTLLGVLIGAPGSSLAVEPDPSAQDPADISHVAIAIDPDVVEFTAASMKGALRSHLPGMAPQVEVRPVDGLEHDRWVEAQLARPRTRAVVWIGRDEDSGLRIELRLPGDGDSWSRRLPATQDPAVQLEQIGAMLSGMLALEPAPAPRDPEQSTTPPPAIPPPPISPPLIIDLSLGYAGEPLAPTSVWTHGAMLESGLGLRSSWWLSLGLGWLPPQRVSAPGDVRVQRVPVQLSGGHRFRRDHRFQPSLLALARVEALGWSPARGEAVIGQRGWGARTALGVGLDGRLPLGRRVFGFARATAQAWLLNSTVVVVEPEGSRTILRAYPVSATLTLGVGTAWARP